MKGPSTAFQGSGLKVWGVGEIVGAWGPGFEAYRLGLRVKGQGCRVQVAGCRVQGAGCRV